MQLELLGRVQAGGRLVEQQQGRIGGKRARDLDQPLMPVGETGNQFIGAGAEADKTQRRHRALVERVGTVADQPVAGPLGADHDVLQRGHRAEQPDVLERTAEACGRALVRRHVGDVGAVEHHFAGGRLVEAGKHVQRRGLARTVRPDQRVNAAAPDRDIDLVDGLQPAEMF